MKRETILSKKIIREIDKSMINSDFKLELNKLLEDKYFNFEIEEWYGEEFKIKGELKNKIIKTLIKVYYDWKMELEKLNKEYYLAIWLHNPRLLKCEIVCAIDEKIAYYENDAHMSSENLSDFDSNQFGSFSNELEKFEWKRKVDIEPYYDWEMEWGKEKYENEKDYFKDQRFYKKLKREKFHVVENEEYGKIYFNPIGDIWIGKLK